MHTLKCFAALNQGKSGIARLRMAALTVAAPSVLIGCAIVRQDGMSPPANDYPTPSTDVPVTIYFDGDCPTGINPETVTVGPLDKIEWSSDPVGKSFRIVYDPFVGPPFDSNAQGKVKSTPVSNDAALNVHYKYTVIGTGCTDKPLDPRIIVN